MADAQPIDPVRFAQALEDLPVDALYSKVAELTNSIEHLRSSNIQMIPFADAGDQDCKDAMFENLGVIGRMNERVSLIKVEVERRGLRWTEGEDNEMVNGHGQLVNGNTTTTTETANNSNSGSLTDDELRRRMEDMIDDEDDEGIHL